MIRVIARRTQAFEGAEAILADAIDSIVPALSGLSGVQAYAPPGKDVTVEVVIGGKAEAGHYGVEERALGFFAVASEERYDPDDVDEENGWREVAERFEAHVNVGSVLAALRDDWETDDAIGRASELESGLVTVAHEVIHVLEWIRETGGFTPIEVFDAGMGEVSLGRVQAAIEAGRPRGSSEDEVEDLARNWTATVFPFHEANDWVDRLDAEFGAPALAP